VISGLEAGFLDFIEVQHVLVAAAVWLVLTVGSLALVLKVVLALPEDYFEAEQPRRAAWTARRVTQNVGGLVLIVVGAVLSIPGVPGQGLLTILIGVFLVDFPERRRLERALLRQRGVLPALNRLRARFRRPPLRPPKPR
jgi:hypothetical protein